MSQNNLYSNYWDRIELQELTERIVRCEACLRLREWCAEVSKVKKLKYSEFDYWGKPVPGFGDPNVRLLVIGLAPGAQGDGLELKDVYVTNIVRCAPLN